MNIRSELACLVKDRFFSRFLMIRRLEVTTRELSHWRLRILAYDLQISISKQTRRCSDGHLEWPQALRLVYQNKWTDNFHSSANRSKRAKRLAWVLSSLTSSAFRQSDRSIQHGIFHITDAFSEKTQENKHRYYWDSREKRFSRTTG